MRLVGVNALQGRHGVCQRGAAPRQGPRTTGPICPDALADHIVKLNVRDLEALRKRVLRALAKAGGFAAKVTGIVDATDLETTAHSEGCGHVTRTRTITDTRGKGHELEGTGSGWKRIVVIEARTKIPLAATVVPITAHETRFLRALVTQARTTLAGHARLHQVVFDRGFGEGVDRWWRDPRGLLLVVPANDTMAVTVDARAQAAAGEGITVGRRAQTGRQGQGKTAWTERLETDVVGLPGLPPDDQDGTPAPGRHANRRDFQPHPIHAVVVRPWNNHAYGPGGKPVFLTNAAVAKPLQPFDDDDARSLIENCGLKERTQPWRLTHPPQKPARAVRVHVVFTLLLFALATAYRLPCEPADRGDEPSGWQRWRRHLLEQPRDHGIICAQDCYGIFPMAEYSLLVGVTLTAVPPGIGTRQDLLAT